MLVGLTDLIAKWLRGADWGFEEVMDETAKGYGNKTNDRGNEVPRVERQQEKERNIEVTTGKQRLWLNIL